MREIKILENLKLKRKLHRERSFYFYRLHFHNRVANILQDINSHNHQTGGIILHDQQGPSPPARFLAPRIIKYKLHLIFQYYLIRQGIRGSRPTLLNIQRRDPARGRGKKEKKRAKNPAEAQPNSLGELVIESNDFKVSPFKGKERRFSLS